MPRMLFVNLPVQDLSTSVAFFASLGFDFNEQFTDEKAACMVVSDQACVMLLARPFFSSFTATPGGKVDLASWPSKLGRGTPSRIASLTLPRR